MLKHEVAGLAHVVTVLATRLCELSPESAQRTKALLEAMIPYADHADTPPSGASVGIMLQRVKALTDHGVDPALVLAVLAQQGAEAGPERLSALNEWNAHATEDELVQDVQQALEKLGIQTVAPADASKKEPQ